MYIKKLKFWPFSGTQSLSILNKSDIYAQYAETDHICRRVMPQLSGFETKAGQMTR